MITLEQLIQIMPNARARAKLFIDPLNLYMESYGIITPKQVAAFLAQLAVESGELRYVKELASGEAYDTGRLAERLGNTPEDDDDGRKYKGRGLIQITGADNYRACGIALGVDLLANPELLETPDLAVKSACWFWSSRSLSAYADRDDFQGITKKINGGLNHYTERCEYWNIAKKVLSGA